MTAQEQQREGVVTVITWMVVGEVGDRGIAGSVQRSGGFPAPPGAVGAPLVDQRSSGDGQQPSSRLLRYPLAWPLHRCREQRFLHRVLAGVKLPVPADQGGEHLRRELAQYAIDLLPARHPNGPVSAVTAAPSDP